MGGVVSVSGRSSVVSVSGSSVCRDRVQLAILARLQQEAFANAQKNYNALQDKIASAINEFVEAHCSLPSDSDKSQCTIQEEEKEEECHDEKDPSIVTEKTTTSKTEEKTRKGNKKKDANTMAEKAGSSTAKKEDNNVEHHPAETREKRFSDVKVQFDEVCKSGSIVCELIDNKSGKVEIAKQHKSILPRSLTSRSFTFTFSKSVAIRSRSFKVGERAEAPEHCSTLEELQTRENALKKLVEYVEVEQKIGGTLSVIVAEESALLAFNKIEKLRDDKLQPQLSALLKGLQESWTSMSKCHKIQDQIMSEKSLYETAVEKDHARTATVNLHIELQNWCATFTSYVCSQKAYIKSLHEWSRHLLPSFSDKGKNSAKGENSEKDNGCTSLLGDWLACMEKLEDKEVTKAMSEFEKELKRLRDQQNKEHECKKKVDKLNEDILNETRRLAKKKNKKGEKLNGLRKTLQNEKTTYRTSKTNTQKIVKNVIQERFALVFKSLTEFTTKAAQDYAEVARKHNIEMD